MVGDTRGCRSLKTLWAIVLATFVSTRGAVAPAETITVTFESAPVQSVSLGSDYWVGNGGFSTQGVSFSGQSWGGFVASQSRELSGWGYFYLPDTPTAAEISAFANAPTGGGAGGSQTFAIAYEASSTINLPAGFSVQSVKATNTATAFYSLRDGDQFARPFGKVFDENVGEAGAWVDVNSPDWFTVTFTGYAGANRTGSVTGQVDFYLADYRFSDPSQDSIVQNWTNIDLSALGEVGSIGLAFASSDTTTYFGVPYINQPQYVALDDLTLVAVPESSGPVPVAVPEPSGLALAACGAAAWVAWRRRPRKA